MAVESSSADPPNPSPRHGAEREERTSRPDQGYFGTYQLVSEPLDPVNERSREGSSSHGRSGGVISREGRAVFEEDRIISTEGTMGAPSGTALDLTGRFDQMEDRFLSIEDTMGAMSGLSQQSFSTPIPHYTMVAQNPFSSIQMSLHKERETRIKILTAAVQKYKVKRDSKSFEEQLQKPSNDLLKLPSTFPSSPLHATAMIEKVEHYKGFHSEVQTEEHDLKVFDDMSLFLEEEVKMKIEAEDVTLDSSATENIIELTSSSIPTSVATNPIMSGRIDSAITVYGNYAEEIVNEIPGWESASSFDEIQESLNTSHSSTGEKQGTSQENVMSFGTTLPGEISSSNCKVIMVACTSRTSSPRQDFFDAAFPESHGSKFTSSPYANEQIQEAPTLQPSLVQVSLQLTPIPQENNFKFIEREMGSYIVSKRTMEIHPEDFHSLDFNLGDSNKPCFNLSKGISSLVGNTGNMRNLGISKSYQMKLWDPGTGSPIMCSHLSGKEYGLVTCTNDGVFWIWNPGIRATNMSVSMLEIIVLQAQGAMTHHFTIPDLSVSSEPDRHQEATIFSTMNIRLPKGPSPFMQHTVARFEEYLTECRQWIEELEKLIRMDPDKISSSSGLALLQSLPNVMSNVYDIVVHAAAKVESLHQYVESMKTAYLADQRHHGDGNDPFPEAYRRETTKQEAAARRIHPSLHLLATSA